MSGAGKTPVYNHAWYQQNQAKIFPQSSESQKVFAVSVGIHKYGPVTMIVPASGHQVRCIPWVQMGTFNKDIDFLCGLKFFALNIFCGPTIKSTFDVASKHTGLLNLCLGKWYLLPYLVVSLISARVPLISTRVSAHCQSILLSR